MSGRARSCRSMPTTPPSTRCMRSMRCCQRGDRGSAQRSARQRRAHRRGRLDGAAHCSKAPRTTTARSSRSPATPSIFITPGYRFKAVDVMMTNFHLPRSTLFMLVSAFCGLDVMQRAYAHAIATGLSFLFLWRCVLAVPGAMTEPFSFRLIATDGAARRGEISTPRGTMQTPAFMPVGTQATVKGAHARRGAPHRRRHPARQHLSPDAAARARSASPRWAACTNS